MPNQLLKIEQNKGVYDRKPEFFSDADLIACTIHAALYSGGAKSLGPSQQGKINMDTTAVAVTSECLYFAFNGISLKQINFQGLDFTKNYAIQNIAVDGIKEKTEYCKDLPPKTEARKNNKIEIYSLRPTKMTVSNEVYLQLLGSAQAKGITKFVSVKDRQINQTAYKDIEVQYDPEKAVLKETYTMKASGSEKKSTLRYDPFDIIKNMLTALLTCGEIKGFPSKAAVLIREKDLPAEHAEMQLLKYFKDEKIDYKKIIGIGVSKTCCHKCADQLEILGIKYSAWSQVDQMGTWWLSPGAISQKFKVEIINF